MTRSIGRKCKDSNVLSQPVLIGRGLDLAMPQPFRPVQLSRCSPPAVPQTAGHHLPTTYNRFPVRIAEGKHPFPFRTRPLSPPAPMVLPGQPGGRVGPCRKTFSARHRGGGAGLLCRAFRGLVEHEEGKIGRASCRERVWIGGGAEAVTEGTEHAWEWVE